MSNWAKITQLVNGRTMTVASKPAVLEKFCRWKDACLDLAGVKAWASVPQRECSLAVNLGRGCGVCLALPLPPLPLLVP